MVKDYITQPSKNDVSMLLNQYLQAFSYLFHDSELNFSADDKLITLFLSSMQFEFNYGEDLVKIGIKCPTIYFIYKGTVEVTLKDKE